MAVKPVPDGYHTLTPHLTVQGAAEAIEFYKRAFGAEEVTRMSDPDGESIMHAEIRIGDSRVMLAEERPAQCGQSPTSLGGTPVSILIYDEDVDAIFERAIDAGAETVVEPQDMFWGDRWGVVEDPFGHRWELATHKEDLSGEEIGERAKAFFSSMSAPVASSW